MVFHCFLNVSTKLISDLLPNCLLVKSGSLVAESKQKLSLSHTSVVTLASKARCVAYDLPILLYLDFPSQARYLWCAHTSILRIAFLGQMYCLFGAQLDRAKLEVIYPSFYWSSSGLRLYQNVFSSGFNPTTYPNPLICWLRARYCAYLISQLVVSHLISCRNSSSLSQAIQPTCE